jgi:hypothetical protein
MGVLDGTAADWLASAVWPWSLSAESAQVQRVQYDEDHRNISGVRTQVGSILPRAVLIDEAIVPNYIW